MSDKAAHHLVSVLTHLNLIDGCRIHASVIAKRIMWGQPTVTPASPTPQTSSPWSRPSQERASPADVLANETHHSFTKGQWRRARFLNHPDVKLTMSVNASDYHAFRRGNGHRLKKLTSQAPRGIWRGLEG